MSFEFPVHILRELLNSSLKIVFSFMAQGAVESLSSFTACLTCMCDERVLRPADLSHHWCEFFGMAVTGFGSTYMVKNPPGKLSLYFHS